MSVLLEPTGTHPVLLARLHLFAVCPVPLAISSSMPNRGPRDPWRTSFQPPPSGQAPSSSSDFIKTNFGQGAGSVSGFSPVSLPQGVQPK